MPQRLVKLKLVFQKCSPDPFGLAARLCTTSAANSSPTIPSDAYKALVKQGKITSDDHQLRVLEQFDRLQEKLTTYQPPIPSVTGIVGKLLGKILSGDSEVEKESKFPKGIYIYGAVGGGKVR